MDHTSTPSSTSSQSSSRCSTPEVVELVEKMRNICERLRREGRQVNLVPTMGSLHDGHASLIKTAALTTNSDNHYLVSEQGSSTCHRQDLEATSNTTEPTTDNEDVDQIDGAKETKLAARTDNLTVNKSKKNISVVVSIFVNPVQFNTLDDYNNYPKTFEADLELCRRLGVDYVFMPKHEEMYPHALDDRGNYSTSLSSEMVMLEPPSGYLQHVTIEGKSRPGHFRGMLTIVCKLFNIIQPCNAFFGEKDYEQLILVKQMVKNLNLNIAIVPVATVRHPVDKLPLSSRNVRLTHNERRIAPILYDIIDNTKQVLENDCKLVNPEGHRDIDITIQACMLSVMCLRLTTEESKIFNVDYLELRCAKDLSKINYDKTSCLFDCARGCVLQRPPDMSRVLNTRLLIAVLVGPVRLLDNVEVSLNQ